MKKLRWIARPCWQSHGPVETFASFGNACRYAYHQAEELAVTYRVWRAEVGKPASCIAWFLPSYERLQQLAAASQAQPDGEEQDAAAA